MKELMQQKFEEFKTKKRNINPAWFERFFNIGLTEEENEKILSKNAEKLFGIER